MSQKKQITCSDGYSISATLHETEEPKGIIIIAGAIGVSQKYYKRFTDSLVSSDFNAITFDYRGTGESIDKENKNVLKLSDWGEQDIEAIIQSSIEANLPVYLIAHSVGGQLAGLAKSSILLKKIVFVAASAPYWKRWSFPGNVKLLFLSKVLLPFISSLTKQFPAKKLGLGNQNLPSVFIKQWALWMTKPNYLFDKKFDLSLEHYKEVKGDILSLGFTDDNLAPEVNIKHLLSFYSNSKSHFKIINPHEVGSRVIGHTGFFRDKYKSNLWKDTINWIESDK